MLTEVTAPTGCKTQLITWLANHRTLQLQAQVANACLLRSDKETTKVLLHYHLLPSRVSSSALWEVFSLGACSVHTHTRAHTYTHTHTHMILNTLHTLINFLSYAWSYLNPMPACKGSCPFHLDVLRATCPKPASRICDSYHQPVHCPYSQEPNSVTWNLDSYLSLPQFKNLALTWPPEDIWNPSTMVISALPPEGPSASPLALLTPFYNRTACEL